MVNSKHLEEHALSNIAERRLKFDVTLQIASHSNANRKSEYRSLML